MKKAIFIVGLMNDHAQRIGITVHRYASRHFGGRTLKNQILQTAKENSFLLWQCGDPAFQVQ